MAGGDVGASHHCSEELRRSLALPAPLNLFVEHAFAEWDLSSSSSSSSPSSLNSSSCSTSEDGCGASSSKSEVRLLHRLFAQSLSLFVNGKGLDSAALASAAELDFREVGREVDLNALCVLRGPATRRLLTAELFRLQQREGASSDLVVKSVKQLLAFALSDPCVSPKAKAAFFSGTTHVLLLLVSGVPGTNAASSSPTRNVVVKPCLDLNVVVDLISEFSKLLPLRSLPLVVRFLLSQRELIAAAFSAKAGDCSGTAAITSSTSQASASAIPSGDASSSSSSSSSSSNGLAVRAAVKPQTRAETPEGRRRLQVAGAKLIGLVKAFEERVKLLDEERLKFDLRALLAECLPLTHAGVSNRTLIRGDDPPFVLDDKETWLEAAKLESDDSSKRIGGSGAGSCPYAVYVHFAKCQKFLQMPDAVLEAGTKETAAAVESLNSVLDFVEKLHFGNSALSALWTRSASPSSQRTARRQLAFLESAAADPWRRDAGVGNENAFCSLCAPPLEERGSSSSPNARTPKNSLEEAGTRVGVINAGGSCKTDGIAISTPLSSEGASLRWLRRLESGAAIAGPRLSSAEFRDAVHAPFFVREFLCRCLLTFHSIASSLWSPSLGQTAGTGQAVSAMSSKKDELDAMQSAAAAALYGKMRGHFSGLDKQVREALVEAHLKAYRLSRLAFPVLRCGKCSQPLENAISEACGEARPCVGSSVELSSLDRFLCDEEIWQAWKSRGCFDAALRPLSLDALTTIPKDASSGEALFLAAEVAVKALSTPAPTLSDRDKEKEKEKEKEKDKEKEKEASALSSQEAAAALAVETAGASAASTELALQRALKRKAQQGRCKRRRTCQESECGEVAELYELLDRLCQSDSSAALDLSPPNVSLLRQAEEWDLLKEAPPSADYSECVFQKKLKLQLEHHLLKLKQDADPRSEVAPEEASSNGPLFRMRLQKMFDIFHAECYDLLSLKTTSCEALASAIQNAEEGRVPLRKNKAECKGDFPSASEAAPVPERSSGTDTSSSTLLDSSTPSKAAALEGLPSS